MTPRIAKSDPRLGRCALTRVRTRSQNQGMANRKVWVVLVVPGLLLFAAGCGSKTTSTKPTTTSTNTNSTSTSSITAATTSTTTTEPSAVPTDSAVWPFVASTTRYSDPVKAATDFAVTYLGFVKPVVGPFMQGDSRSGEVDIRANKLGTATTAVMVRKLAPSETWWVLGAATTNLQLQSPGWNAPITSPVTLSGQSTAFEATVSVEIRQDGSLTPIGSDFVMGGSNGTMGPFSKAVTFIQPTAQRGAIVFKMPSTDGAGTLEAGVIRVRFP